MATREDDVVLDFFAGSCSTAHAILEQNREDSGRRKFICVQLPEPISLDSLAYREGYRLIPEIGKERVRRVLTKMREAISGQLDFNTAEDLGFRCYRLDRSSFRDWQPLQEPDTNQLELLFRQAETPLVENWESDNLLTEIMLIQGFPLDSRIRTLPEFHHNHVLEVASEFCQHHLYVCLDSALTDQAKIALADRCNLKVI